MRTLPLYVSPPSIAIDVETPLRTDTNCTRCDMHVSATHKCIAADGTPGGLLVVGDALGQREDVIGRPFVGAAGQLARKLVDKYWGGPVVYASAVSCYSKGVELKSKHVEACRPYLAGVMQEKFSRIITLGAIASLAVLGRATKPFSTRRGYAFRSGYLGECTPIFSVMHPLASLRNRIVMGWLETDLKWALTETPKPPPWGGSVHVIETHDDAKHAIAEMRKADWAAFDCETAGGMRTRAFRVLSVALCAKGSSDSYVWGKGLLSQWHYAPTQELFRYLRDPQSRKLGQNVKYDVQAIHAGLSVRTLGVDGDTRLWRKLLEPEADADLATMAELVGMGGLKEENAVAMHAAVEGVRRVLNAERKASKSEVEATKNLAQGTRRTTKPNPQVGTLAQLGVDRDLEQVIRDPNASVASWSYALVDDETLYRYNARDAVATSALGAKLIDDLSAKPALQRTWDLIVRDASWAIERVENWGVACDRAAVLTFDDYLGRLLDTCDAKLAGHTQSVNWASPKQVGEYLYVTLKLPCEKKTASGAMSTDEGSLARLRGKHEVVDLLLEHRGLSKLRGTYAAGADGNGGMLAHIRPDGRIHPSILLDGARSGRLSCQNPALQTIPSEKNDPESGPFFGRMCRDIFIAPAGHSLVQLDYSQVELRIAAMLSGDEKMIDVFRSGADYHQRTAELISQTAWGIPPSRVEKRHRSLAKTVNFALLYGKTAGTLAHDMGCTAREAQAIIDAIFGTFKRLAAWCKTQLSDARKTGVVHTHWAGEVARSRPLWRIADADEGARKNAENAAVNSTVQGTASDLCVRSLADAVGWIDEEKLPAKLVLPIHDALLFEVRNDAIEELAIGASQIMLSHDTAGVPMAVDVDFGVGWGSLKKFSVS